jgi:hypothetical protein
VKRLSGLLRLVLPKYVQSCQIHGNQYMGLYCVACVGGAN